jgi:mannose-1-phosphate guanylyltransferase/mannose-6-phosphate isomerase
MSSDPLPGAFARWTTTAEAANWWSHWFHSLCLPLWASAGFDAATAGFREGLHPDGTPHDAFRRTRVQARQVFVFGAVARSPEEPHFDLARRAFWRLRNYAQRSDGLYATRATPSGHILDARAYLYDQAFILLALSALARKEPASTVWRREAHSLRRAIEAYRHERGGFREVGDAPFQANAQMHLLEAALAWETVEPDGAWRVLADELANLALDRFIADGTGLLSEFFDAHWRPHTGEPGLLEPGHHFEWAWLLDRWAQLRNSGAGAAAAAQLFETGLHGVDPRRGVAVSAIWPDLSPRDPVARLWPQTEWLKAALRLGRPGEVLRACSALALYAEGAQEGAWRDRLRLDGAFVEEPAPASSLYHVAIAVLELERAHATQGGPPLGARVLESVRH